MHVLVTAMQDGSWPTGVSESGLIIAVDWRCCDEVGVFLGEERVYGGTGIFLYFGEAAEARHTSVEALHCAVSWKRVYCFVG
jgi:hypothetical protein